MLDTATKHLHIISVEINFLFSSLFLEVLYRPTMNWVVTLEKGLHSIWVCKNFDGIEPLFDSIIKRVIKLMFHGIGNMISTWMTFKNIWI